jgi:hypothetical protein
MELLTDSAQLEPIDIAPIRAGLAGLLDPVVAVGAAILTVVPIDPEVLADGVEAWNTFKALPADLELVPIAAVQGVRLSVPIRIRNPNDFPLRTPALAAGAFFGTLPPPSDSAPPDQAIARILYPGPDASMLPPYDGSAATLVDTDLLMEVRWSNGGQGLAAFLGSGSPSSSYLDSVLELDLGYGTIQVPFRAAVPNLLLVP